jgi:hypothetical protein
MGRKFLMVVLAVGAVAGFASGFGRLCYGGACHFGPGGRFDRHAEFERHVADTCTEAALRVYNRPNPTGPKP